MIVGIDLGTTNSGVSVVKNGAPQMLPNGDERIIPSVVGYSPRGQWLVGTPARNQYVLDPDNTVQSIKRQMGADTQIQLGGRTFTPPEISAFILRELKTVAERNLGQEIDEAVITVPAYFSDAARRATRDAGKIAGFDVRRIINEPTAAALAYGLNMVEDQMVLVYDLGGGTFDVSLVELMGGIVEVRASHGNTHLGGDDFDLRLTELIAQRFEEQHGIDLRQNRRAWARLIRATEAAKIELSSHPFAWIREEYIAESRGIPLHLEYEVSRQEFIEAIGDLLEQTLVSIDQVMQDGRVTPDEITQVLLVGGSTRIPAIWDMVANYLDTEPHMSINPEEVVALGAGVQAAIIDGVPIDAILVDVTPHSLGIEVAEVRMGRIISDRYNVLIHRNTTIPVTKEEVYSTLHPEQDKVQIAVYQGESAIASENVLLDKFMITDLEPEHPGELAKVTVRFDFDVNGILKVTAQDRRTGQEKDITIEASKTRLSEIDILKAQKQIDQTVAQSATLAVLTGRAKRLLEGDQLEKEAHAQLETLLADIQAAQDTQMAEDADEAEDLPRLSDMEDELLDLLFDLEND
ncbi:MAG TPA: heat-shock protein Hsp70 [Chloroflexi bacterium]|nr:heat-shock protein Hsp70 [Chloroflexota bacterium]